MGEDPPTLLSIFREGKLGDNIVGHGLCNYKESNMNISYDIVLLGESPMLKIHGFIGVSYIRYEPTALATKNLEISTKVALDKAHTWAEILGRENKNKGGGTDSGKYDRTPYNVRECN